MPNPLAPADTQFETYRDREQIVIKNLEAKCEPPEPSTAPIVFINPGHLDPRSFQVFGLSAKPDSTNPIGQFGTGLKYAIAVCLRHNCSIEIELAPPSGQPHTRSRIFSFSARRGEFRGQNTTEIWCQESDSEPFRLPFTLQLGAHWELWQAFRELESNVRDENGQSGIDLRCDLHAPTTHIRVYGQPFREVYNNRYEYFLHPTFYRSAGQSEDAFYALENTKSFYYKGVRVYSTDSEFLFTYDFRTEVPLTEDRTVSSVWTMRAALRRHWLECNDSDAIFEAITAPKNTEEYSVEYADSLYTPSEAFKAAVHRALSERPVALNRSARKAAQTDALDERFVKSFELSELEQGRLDKATQFLTRLGYRVDQYPIRLVDIDSELAGMAKNNTIILTRIAFSQSTLYLASTILEEFFHLKYGYSDHTHAFQDFLHDEILRMGERVLGEPL